MKRFLAFCVVSILAATNASAATLPPVTQFNFDGVMNFSDGTLVGGSFNYDVSNTFTVDDLAVLCDGTLCYREFYPVTSFGNPLLLQVTGTDDNGDTLRFDMHFLDELNLYGGIFEVDYAVFVNLDKEIFLIFDEPFTVSASAVPVPAAAWLFGSALAGLGWLRRKPLG